MEWTSYNIFAMIRETGFPIFVALYVLLRLEPTIGKLDKTIRFQTIIIAKICHVDYITEARKHGIDPKDVV